MRLILLLAVVSTGVALRQNSSSYVQRLFNRLAKVVEDRYDQMKEVAPTKHHMPNFVKETIQRSQRSLARLNRKVTKYLFDGDMLIESRKLEEIVNMQEQEGRKKRQAYLDRYYPSTIWLEGVPYEFEDGLDRAAVRSIQQAIDFWQAETCIDFYRRANESQYLFFTGDDDGCYSTVGRDEGQTQQQCNLGPGCYHFGVTSHEVAHALGLFHHQQRYDRDKYIKFVKQNAEPDYLQNFALLSQRFLSTYNTPYDVGSVMHYTPTEFSRANAAVLKTLDPLRQNSMGSMDRPSFLDVFVLNKHYKCLTNCATKPKCLNGGYVNPRNCLVCKCPSGFGGQLCNVIEQSSMESCGGLIPATDQIQSLTISLESTATRRLCAYQIKAPKKKRVLIGVEYVRGKCQEGCYTTAMEMKIRGDFRPVGYRFCCQSHAFERVISTGRVVPLSFYAEGSNLYATVYFRTVPSSGVVPSGISLIPSDHQMPVFTQIDPNGGVNVTVSIDVPDEEVVDYPDFESTAPPSPPSSTTPLDTTTPLPTTPSTTTQTASGRKKYTKATKAPRNSTKSKTGPNSVPRRISKFSPQLLDRLKKMGMEKRGGGMHRVETQRRIAYDDHGLLFLEDHPSTEAPEEEEGEEENGSPNTWDVLLSLQENLALYGSNGFSNDDFSMPEESEPVFVQKEEKEEDVIEVETTDTETEDGRLHLVLSSDRN